MKSPSMEAENKLYDKVRKPFKVVFMVMLGVFILGATLRLIYAIFVLLTNL
ncbi:hypothetical protein DEALK_00850 [Dehalogenimonas alkenigignens]|uniref:Uncharacterized protein n=1 Tax=Dehalogenimonas alkenigignens TaxID=1217799 RepID=A0A0W0GKV0_9CHLR|nr:hypothetical protein DEALK_00850 [Dehalogenimonas alkenigignens]